MTEVVQFVGRKNQEQFLVKNPMDQIKQFYLGDNRNMILQALTGSGKTYASIMGLIPEWIRECHTPSKQSVIIFTSKFMEVVDGSSVIAKNNLDKKVINNLNNNIVQFTRAGQTYSPKIRVYSGADLKNFEVQEAKLEQNRSLDGDVLVIFSGLDFLKKNINLFDTTTGKYKCNLLIIDEGHFAVGCQGAEDTKEDKGVRNNSFNPKTLNTITERLDCPKLFMTATPTNSQQVKTSMGGKNNHYLPPMPIDKNTRPAYEIPEYNTIELVFKYGNKHYSDRIAEEDRLINAIHKETWRIINPGIQQTRSACLVRAARSNTSNGMNDLPELMKKEKKAVNTANILLSTSKEKKFNGKKIKTFVDGLKMSSALESYPFYINVVDSGYAGVDVPRLKTIIFARSPTEVLVENNSIQLYGRASRIMFFESHTDFIQFINALRISDEQKVLVAEYYILMNTASVFVLTDNKNLEAATDHYLETTYREDELRSIILNGIKEKVSVVNNVIDTDDINNVMSLTNQGYKLENDIYKKYKKDDCEVCAKTDGIHADCFVTFTKSSKKKSSKLTEEEAKQVWKQVLGIHHDDGNHLNNTPSNLVTVCPNYHGGQTIMENHSANRYTEVRLIVSNSK